MKRLTSEAYWSKNYDKKKKKVVYASSRFSSMSFYFYDLHRTIKPFMPKKGKMIEIGCAPGNVLVELSKRFGLEPYGVEYTKTGCLLTKEVFRKNKFNPNNVLHKDFFSDDFQKNNKKKYDVVCSFGFIEHFEDPAKVIKAHSDLLKKNGLLIITLPNLNYGNKTLTPKKILAKHNLNIMNINRVRQSVPKEIEINVLKYFGGPFNTGLYSYESKVLESARFAAFVCQRIILDPVWIILKKARIGLENKYFSPGIILIGRKK